MADQMADQMVDEKADQMVDQMAGSTARCSEYERADQMALLKVDQTAALMALLKVGSMGFHWVGLTARRKVGQRVAYLVH